VTLFPPPPHFPLLLPLPSAFIHFSFSFSRAAPSDPLCIQFCVQYVSYPGRVIPLSCSLISTPVKTFWGLTSPLFFLQEVVFLFFSFFGPLGEQYFRSLLKKLLFLRKHELRFRSCLLLSIFFFSFDARSFFSPPPYLFPCTTPL